MNNPLLDCKNIVFKWEYSISYLCWVISFKTDAIVTLELLKKGDLIYLSTSLVVKRILMQFMTRELLQISYWCRMRWRVAWTHSFVFWVNGFSKAFSTCLIQNESVLHYVKRLDFSCFLYHSGLCIRIVFQCS